MEKFHYIEKKIEYLQGFHVDDRVLGEVSVSKVLKKK